jgi:hypothetical protein
MEIWVKQALEANVDLMGDVICEKWKGMTCHAGIPSDKWLALSHGWLSSFKACNRLCLIRKHVKAASAQEADVEEEREPLCKILENFNPVDIFRMDETSLFYACIVLLLQPSHTLVPNAASDSFLS